ncbi:MAG: ATP-binding protein [Deinococcales bacterium]
MNSSTGNNGTENHAIGIVLGTKSATPLDFYFAVQLGVKIQLDDIVFIEVQDPADYAEVIRFYGVVDEVKRSYEGVQFDGDTELVAAGLMPANISYIAHVIVTRVEPEDFIPPSPSDVVYLASGEALDKALYLDNMELPLPAGVLRNGEAGYINFEFINGSKGAHINISGISGIATKTSYALFLLYSIFYAHNRHKDRPEPLLDKAQHSKAIIFNVKGEDLFFLDKANNRFVEQEEKWRSKRKLDKNRFEICGLKASAFDNVSFHGPAKDERGTNLIADITSREDVSPYLWTIKDFALLRMLPFVLVDGDSMSNLGFLAAHVEEKLYKLAEHQTGPHLVVEPFSHFLQEEVAAELKAKAEQKKAQRGRGVDRIASDDDYDAGEMFGPSAGHFFDRDAKAEEKLLSFNDLVNYLSFKILGTGIEDYYKDGDSAWTANQSRATREAFIRRMRGASKHVSRIIRGDLPAKAFQRAKLDILNSSEQVHVVDINKLAPLAQMFVVGVLLKQVFSEKENYSAGRGHVFVVLDELNKYAPAEGNSPIKDVLLDIAERGRSLGIILIGAQQTASEGKGASWAREIFASSLGARCG